MQLNKRKKKKKGNTIPVQMKVLDRHIHNSSSDGSIVFPDAIQITPI